MQEESVSIEYVAKRIKNVFGGSNVEVEYIMKHAKYGRVNRYKVTCRIDGIESRDPHLTVTDTEFLGNMETESNDETLTPEAVGYLFEDNI